MRKDELVIEVANRTGLSKAKARDAVAALFGTRSAGPGIITEQLASGGPVHIGDFGTFGTVRAATAQPGEPAARPYFRPSSVLRQRLAYGERQIGRSAEVA